MYSIHMANQWQSGCTFEKLRRKSDRKGNAANGYWFRQPAPPRRQQAAEVQRSD
jgi:hypothetical protein